MTKRMAKFPEVRDFCSHCGKEVATYIPKDGNGAQRNAYRHAQYGADKGKGTCPGSRRATEKWGDGAA